MTPRTRRGCDTLDCRGGHYAKGLCRKCYGQMLARPAREARRSIREAATRARHAEIVAHFQQTGNNCATARALGVHNSWVSRVVRSVRPLDDDTGEQ